MMMFLMVTTMSKETGTSINIKKNLVKYQEFISFARFYPDRFLDLIKPEKGGINLHLDQRILCGLLSDFTALMVCLLVDIQKHIQKFCV